MKYNYIHDQACSWCKNHHRRHYQPTAEIWGEAGNAANVDFAPKPLPHHSTHHVRSSLALPMSNALDVSNNQRLSLHNLSDLCIKY